MLKDIKIGNGNGEYSNYNVIEFNNALKVAKEILKNDDSYYDIEKAAYKNLNEAIDKFKDSKNSNSISKSEVKTLKVKSSKKSKVVKLGNKNSVTWNISGDKINSPNDINLDVKLKSPYINRINEYINKLDLKCRKMSFYHNGNMPGELEVSVDFNYDEKENKICVYKFDVENDSLIFKGDAVVQESKVNFSINEGGDYLLLIDKLETYASPEKIEEVKNEIKENEKNLDLKDKKEEIESQDTTVKNHDNTNKDKNGNSNSQNNNEKIDTNKSDQSDNENNKPDNNQNSNPNNNDNSNQKPAEEPIEQPVENNKVTCTIEIRCDTLAGTDKLVNLEKEPFVPQNGTILGTTQVTVDKGKTVYDVLLSVCRNNNIQIDAEYTTLYSSYYVKGINFLYEFDGGDLSGWMYKVNEEFPHYGCSKYEVKDGDVISWVYTCDMGSDVGEDHSFWS